ncbi:MAG: ATP-dependent DNA helicase RecG [Candidatus Moranbacteria bacterium RIFCSPHIGHO2_01_FULL_55_24]|nr:MAG: ATP-dependent DNA helicase RecG [Candidatus Moranbacteria bacterium RIFCSPHIGHO2_01_FULL_55_24]
MSSLDTLLSSIPSIKKPVLAKLQNMGLLTVGDLFSHLPHRYEDYATIRPIASLAAGEKCTVLGTVTKLHSGKSFRKRMLVTEISVADDSGTLRVVWFNQRFIATALKVGSAVRLSGKVTADKGGLLMTNPELERAERDATHTGRLVPVYPETRGLTSRFFRWQITALFQKIKAIPDPVPQEILERLHLPSYHQSLRYLHFPKNEKEILLAEKRSAFDEMFLVQLKALQLKALFETSLAESLELPPQILENFIETLPFSLTGAQKKAVGEILDDLAGPHPMNRLLNGDVGSGKTVVAAVAALAAAGQGCQVALLAPTEVLARQHFESLSSLFAPGGETVSLFTGSYRLLDGKTVTRKTMQKAIESGIPKIIVGTHALLQEDVRFQKLALVIVDEQHRFGVAQRAKLQDMSFGSQDGQADRVPHFLTMTATPIPRTLSLAFFGNLEISLLDELPKNRKPIITKLVKNQTAREKVYQFINQEIKKGRQAFIIFPLVEESLALKEVKAAVKEHEKLTHKIFPHLSVGLIHGKLKAKEKEDIMHAFREKDYDILVATAVVEVGVDVPNASIILIEEAERFGLAQLHQFRGRVGRGEHQSYCFLVPGENAKNLERLEVLEKEASGFAIAEADLALRGPGAFFGTRQSGLPDIAMENLTNMKLVTIARDEAKGILANDPHLEKHPALREALKRFEERVHFE